MKIEHIFETASALSAMTILTRFAKALIAHGFEAEVKKSSKPGIINSSKLCIEVKGYGLKDTLKLYKPLWRHERGMIAFVDVKHERRFASVTDMVVQLKDKYPKLPKCLSYTPPPEKLKESQGANVKQRILKFQQELLDTFDDISMNDILHMTKSFDGTEHDRYVLIIELAHLTHPVASQKRDSMRHYVIRIDDFSTLKINGISPKYKQQLVRIDVALAKRGTPFDKLKDLNYNKSFNKLGLTSAWGEDESDSGIQDAFDNLLTMLKQSYDVIILPQTA